jgi:hypothetical protein
VPNPSPADPAGAPRLSRRLARRIAAALVPLTLIIAAAGIYGVQTDLAHAVTYGCGALFGLGAGALHRDQQKEPRS